MPKGIYSVPKAINENIRIYKKNSKERIDLENIYNKMYNNKIDIPQYIGSEKIYSSKKIAINPPHDHNVTIGYWNKGEKNDIDKAIKCALDARYNWNNLSYDNRASIFLKAADLISGPYRNKINAATMICQSKNILQAEIDAACELSDFLRFNVQYMEKIYKEQPISGYGVWNRMEYRSLEGFLLAITPFNFTAISGNLPSCMAMMGNVVIWKPSDKQIYSAKVIMDIFIEAGLPEGVINMVLVDGLTLSQVVFKNKYFSGVHFTGSTKVFQNIWKEIGNNIDNYINYPRIVGETGGKDFIWSHNTASKKELSTAILRGAFEYQGQKCSAVSRCYIPKSIWTDLKKILVEEVQSMKMGSPIDPSNFINAVIDRESFMNIKGYIDRAKNNINTSIIAGGNCNDSIGYFIEPTIIQVFDYEYESMLDEIFGPVLSIYVYDDEKWIEILNLIDSTSKYALTGSIFCNDRYVIEFATKSLINSAGNFYINDKPTGAIVGNQPFGGSRLSGTNDKSGSMINLLRWISVRTIKENFIPDINYRYS